ncbi:12278_t:CDS:2, partial [Cetraspora pellucida]
SESNIELEVLIEYNSTEDFSKTDRKLPKKILKEIHFLTVVAKANATIQYQIIQKKYKTRIHRPDLYNAISRFHYNSELEKNDTRLLLKRLYKKKIKDPH